MPEPHSMRAEAREKERKRERDGKRVKDTRKGLRKSKHGLVEARE